MPNLLEEALKKKALQEKAKTAPVQTPVESQVVTPVVDTRVTRPKQESNKTEPVKRVKREPKQVKEVIEPLPKEPEQIKHVDMTVDVMRAIYFMLFKNYDYKTMSKNDLKTKINELIATPTGFGKLLDGLKQFVFS